ncbi:gluconokinase [Sphingobium aquiterrae]|uniref:gluconokinase n=1 Tax=Sphingobium aquiterrae TaxID=2038656 RepID=UPI0030196B7B
MGVSGSGKSTLGALLADRLNCAFLEGDLFHLPASIAKMVAGKPLSDEDRWPWLDQLGSAMGRTMTANGVAVAACSALKRSYRDRLNMAVGGKSAFVLLNTDKDEIARRLGARQGHYMPVSLLESQLAALEPPSPEEPALILDARRSPDELCRSTYEWLRQSFP